MATETDLVAAQLFTTGVGRRYRYEWALFADWCVAMEHRLLPADSATILDFLIANPAGTATQVRRVSAINWVHRRHGQPEPGAAPALREALDSRRQHRLADLRVHLASILHRLPESGWPQGVFGRRDAALLLFAGGGLSFEQISRLRREQVSVDGDGGICVNGHRIDTDWVGRPEPRPTAGGPLSSISPLRIRVPGRWRRHFETIRLLYNCFRRSRW